MLSESGRLLLVLLLAGCAAGEPPLGATHAPIVGGTLGGNPAVVVLQNYRSGGICTGTLIAERVVLTAKHCVQQPFAEAPVSASSIVVGVGDSLRGLTATLRVRSIRTTPGVYTVDSRGGLGTGLVGEDVAVMVLESGVPGVAPIPVRREHPSALVGQTITAVGFGETPSGDVGRKYTSTGRIEDVRGNLIFVGPLTCQGDSGGPAITEDGEVAGVVSFGAGSCGRGYGAYNAIHEYLALIDEALIEAGSCLDDGPERCDGGDNDCDGEVDETCTPIGGACSADDECVGQRCRDTEAGRICTTACDPLRPALGCGPGLYCARTSGCEGQCAPLPEEREMRADGEACTNDAQCASLFCTDPGDGRRRCLTPCLGDAGSCLSGEACAAPPGACGACVPEEIVSGLRGLGERCDLAERCRSGLCYEDDGRRYCSRACTADTECPSGYHCRPTRDDDGRESGVCAAGPRSGIGDPCLGNGDCAPMTFCATQLDASWCTRFCSEADPCPANFACVAAGDARVCAPERAFLGDACADDEDCISGLCARDAGASEGTCTRACGPEAACAVGLECRRADDGVSAFCVEPDAAPRGGCTVGAPRGAARWPWGAALLALAIAIARRRRSA